MSKLIEANEFGDWLIGEIAQAKTQMASVNPDVALCARLRLGNLKTAKKSLLEFLKIQQAMLQAAREARRKLHEAAPSRAARQNSRTLGNFDAASGASQTRRGFGA